MGTRAILFVLVLALTLQFSAGAVADELRSVQLAKAAAANPGRSAEEVLLKFVAAEKELAGLVGEASFASARCDLEWQWATLLSAKGMFIQERIKRNPDLAGVIGPTGVDALRRAVALYDAAADGRDELLRDMRGDPAAAQLSWEARRARFYSCTAEYQLGLALPEGGTAREDQQKVTVSKLSDFVWDNEDNILGGYAYLYLALAYQDLGQDAKALEFFRVVAGAYPVPSQEDAENYGKWSDLFLQGYYKLAEFGNRVGRSGNLGYREIALQILEFMPGRVPDCWQRQFGQLALIQQAQILVDLGEPKEAQAILDRVIEECGNLPETEFWRDASAFLAEQVLAQISAGDLTLADLARAAHFKMGAGEWAKAEADLLEVIDRCRTPEEMRKFGAPAGMKVGECCYRDNRYQDAYEAYDRLLQIPGFAETEQAGDAAYYRYRAATALADQIRTPEALELKTKARADFATAYPNHPRAIDLRYYLGADQVAEGDRLRVDEKGPAAVETYEEALANFGSVKPASVLYAKARARIVEVRYKLDAWEEALTQMVEVLSYLEDPKHRTTDRERIANRLRAGAIATYYGALACEQLTDWKTMSRLLEGFETKYGAEELRGFHASVEAARQRAQKGLEETEPEDD